MNDTLKALLQAAAANSGLNVNALTAAAGSLRDAAAQLKQIDSLLTDIRRLSPSLSQKELDAIAGSASDTAGSYGRKTADYLESLRALTRAGQENASRLAELSLAAQNAGNMNAELAARYIHTADEAYRLGGSLEALTRLLDGTASLSAGNALSMEELSQAMTLAAPEAAKAGMEAKETAALLGTILDTTGQDASQASGSLLALLGCLRQVSDTLNVSLKETRNGVLSLREPTEILKDLSEAYAGLSASDPRRADLLNAAGGGSASEAFAALLENYDLYETMLQQYETGAGTLAEQARLSADTWEGAMNRLSNTWADTVGNLADSQAVTAGINSLNSLLSVINSITNTLGPLKSIGLGAAIFAIYKNVDYLKMLVCPLHI